MEKIKEDYIINEDNGILDYDLLIENCICKIKINEENEIENKKLGKKKTGFFCNIKSKNFKIFVTNNHIIDKDFLNKEKRLIIFIDDEKKEINLELDRFKFTDEKLDFTIIEILEEDNIHYYLEIEENIEFKEYKELEILSVRHSGKKKLSYSKGKILNRTENYFEMSFETKGGASGSPILLKNNLKVIGLYRGKYQENQNVSLCVPVDLIINKINFIKCTYSINEENIGKEIQILNNGYYDEFELFPKK